MATKKKKPALTATGTTVSVQTNLTPASSPDATFTTVGAVADLAPIPIAHRRKLLDINAGVLLSLFREMAASKPGRMTCEALPDDLKVVGTIADQPYHLLRLVVESQTFDLIPDGTPYPSFNLVIRREI